MRKKILSLFFIAFSIYCFALNNNKVLATRSNFLVAITFNNTDSLKIKLKIAEDHYNKNNKTSQRIYVVVTNFKCHKIFQQI